MDMSLNMGVVCDGGHVNGEAVHHLLLRAEEGAEVNVKVDVAPDVCEAL